MAFTESLSFDRRLALDDIAGSRAHVAGLNRCGLLDDSEVDAILSALDEVEAELAEGRFVFLRSDEDIHTAVERRTTEIAGDAGAKMHTGRSRNDQVATDLRLFVKHELGTVVGLVQALQRTLVAKARENSDVYLPGYTHVQRAQPVMLGHHFAAHAWALQRDVIRLRAAHVAADVSPLGAGALAGSSLPLLPEVNAKALGFSAVFDNSLDAVSDRDFVADVLYAVAMLGIHLSRIGEEFVLWSSEEFGFVRLDDAYSTGSSMLPQKKNADIAELARGKTGRFVGNLTSLLVTLKGLPLSYNRDLQEDKEPLFDSLDQIVPALIAVDGMVATATYLSEPMQAAADVPAAAAIDLAEWLVERGTPFRHAHAIVGALVRRSIDERASLIELVRASGELGPEAASLLAPGVPVTRRTTPGGAGPQSVEAQLGRLEALLSE